jgi:predicted CopG family antitoxin
MVEKKNIKVTTPTYDAIVAEQKEGESMDDTLQRILGLTPDADDVERGIAAYLSDEELRKQVKELVDFINSLEDFGTEVMYGEGNAGDDVLRFFSKGSGVAVAKLECGEFGYTLKYRDNTGDFDTIRATVSDTNDVEMEELKEKVREKVEGAYRRWGET